MYKFDESSYQESEKNKKIGKRFFWSIPVIFFCIFLGQTFISFFQSLETFQREEMERLEYEKIDKKILEHEKRYGPIVTDSFTDSESNTPNPPIRAINADLIPENKIYKTINYFLILFGILFIIIIPLLITLGILFLRKKELKPEIEYDKRSGNKNAPTPKEIHHFNWGAFGLPFIWGFYHKTWSVIVLYILSFIISFFIPLIGLIFLLAIGYYANAFAWEKNKYKSIEDFLYLQKKWKVWGITFFIINILLNIFIMQSM
jgi:hypothetical protein